MMRERKKFHFWGDKGGTYRSKTVASPALCSAIPALVTHNSSRTYRVTVKSHIEYDYMQFQNVLGQIGVRTLNSSRCGVENDVEGEKGVEAIRVTCSQ